MTARERVAAFGSRSTIAGWAAISLSPKSYRSARYRVCRPLDYPARLGLDLVQAPNANAYAERFVRSTRAKCLDRVIIFGERRLRHALSEFIVHYHEERNHPGLGNDLIAPTSGASVRSAVCCRDRLGGLLRYYYYVLRGVSVDEFSD